MITCQFFSFWGTKFCREYLQTILLCYVCTLVINNLLIVSFVMVIFSYPWDREAVNFSCSLTIKLWWMQFKSSCRYCTRLQVFFHSTFLEMSPPRFLSCCSLSDFLCFYFLWLVAEKKSKVYSNWWEDTPSVETRPCENLPRERGCQSSCGEYNLLCIL